MIPARVEPLDEARTRRALLHMLEDLQHDRAVLRQARRRWLSTVDALTDAVMVHDAGGRVLRCNRAYSALAGTPIEKVIGRPYREMFPRGEGPSHDITGAGEPGPGEELRLPTGAVYTSRAFSFAPIAGEPVACLHVYQDITESTRAKQALEGSERRYRALTENAADLVCIIGGDGKLDYVSPSLKDMGDYSPEEVLRRPFVEFVHPQDVPAALSALAELARKPDQAVHAQLRYRHKDGHYIDLESIATNLLDDPAIRGIVVNARDVTERKRAEAALRDSEGTYRALFDNMLNSIAHCRVLFDNGEPVDFVYLRVNAAFTAQTGLKDVVGRRVTEVIPGIGAADPGIFQRYARVVATGVPERFEIFIQSLQQWHRVSLFRLAAEEFVSVFDVVTEEKRRERDLQLFRQLVDRSGDAIEVIDPHTLRFIDVNETACRELGYTRAELLSMGVPDIDAQHDAAAGAAFVEGLAGEAGSLERVHRRKDGSTFPVELSVARIELDRPYLVAIVRDITERRASEAKLRAQLEELQRWQAANLDREDRVLELKREVNALAARLGQAPPYPSALP